MWDYAELSRKAKEFGGPENFVNLLEAEAKEQGRNELLAELMQYAELDNTSSKTTILLGIGALIGAAAGVVLSAVLGKHYLAKKQQELIDKAKSELIEGIKAYDEAHPDPEENEEKKGEWVRAK